MDQLRRCHFGILFHFIDRQEAMLSKYNVLLLVVIYIECIGYACIFFAHMHQVPIPIG